VAGWTSIGVEKFPQNQAIRRNFFDVQSPNSTARLDNDEHVAGLQRPPRQGLDLPIRWPNSLNRNVIPLL
jgi:hypothetical protein